jgi:phosphatidate cytidylyltransferase
MFWVIGFLIFVLTLKKGFYKYQFRQFIWTHMTCFLIISQCAAFIGNIYEGLIWFVMPASFVVCNDIMAYIFGFFFGRTKLIELSPRKTWEGFIGGLISTLVFAHVICKVFADVPYLMCPQLDLVVKPFTSLDLRCEASNLITPWPLHLPYPFKLIGLEYIHMTDLQVHSMVLACFGSLISPFGGFFASGFKRALKIKVQCIDCRC